MSKNQRCLKASGRLDSGISSFTPDSKRSFLLLFKSRTHCLFSTRVGVTGFEPVTLRLSSACSNQLSYTPRRPRPDHLHPGHLLVEAWGFEPQTYSLQSYRSTN